MSDQRIEQGVSERSVYEVNFSLAIVQALVLGASVAGVTLQWFGYFLAN